MKDDTISRQAAIDICTNAIDLWHGQLGEGALVAVQGRIKALPPVQSEPKSYRMGYQAGYAAAAPRWIPCSKKLPELNRSVLVQLSDDFVDPIQIMTLNISKCEGDFFYFWKTQEMGINFEMGDVVAWMPLPTPAKIEG